MSRSLYLKIDNHKIWLGRPDYVFQIGHESNLKEAVKNFDRLDELVKDMEFSMVAATAYCPKNREELEGMLTDLENDIEYTVEEILMHGRRQLLQQIVEDAEEGKKEVELFIE